MWELQALASDDQRRMPGQFEAHPQPDEELKQPLQMFREGSPKVHQRHLSQLDSSSAY